jgi:WD40 repeat protein
VGADSKINLFDGKDGTLVKAIKDEKSGHKSNILDFSWSPDSKRILTASMDKTAKIWNIASGAVETTFDIGSKNASHLFQQVGTVWFKEYIMSVSLSGVFNVLDEKNPEQIRTIQGHQQPMTSAAHSAKLGVVFTADNTGVVTCWDVAKGAGHWFSGSGHNSKPISGMSVNADATFLWTVGFDNTLKYNELKGNQFSSSGTALSGQPVTVVASRRDPKLAAVLLAQSLCIVREDKVVSTTDVKVNVFTASFSQDDTQIAVGCQDGKVRLFTLDKDAPTLTATLANHQGKVVYVNWSNENVLVSQGWDRNIFFWDLKKGDVINGNGWPFHGASPLCSSFSPNGSLMITAGQDQNLILWSDLKTYDHTKNVRQDLCHIGGCDYVGFFSDDTFISVGFLERTVKFWKL